MDNKKIYSSKQELLKFLDIKENFLYPNFSNKYKEKEKPKKKGGSCLIKAPNFNLKKVQRKILDKILISSPQLACVYGLSMNKSILTNAKAHQKNFGAYLLVLDIENFFTSISKNQVNRIFKKNGFNRENSSILTKLCTAEDSLPQGAPTSPYLASLVCSKLDKEIYTYCQRRKFIYTRYFDDISISGKKILPDNIENIERIISKHRFKCNRQKGNVFDVGKDKIINGILAKESGLTVTDDYKKEIENIYKEVIKDNNIHNKRIFAGKFGFYLHVNKIEATVFLKELKKHYEK